MDNLDDFLKGDNEPTAEVETPEAATPEAPEAAETPQPEAQAEPEGEKPKVERQRDPATGKFIPKGEEVESPSTEEPQSTIPESALIGERRRRQEAEDRLRALEQQLQSMQQPQPTQEQGPPDRWEDPEGYDRWLMNQVSQAAEQRAIEAFQYQRIATAAQQYMADKPDYQEVVNVFGQMANVNPGLVQQMQAAPNPAQFAYETAKLQMEISQYGGLDGLINARLEAKLKASAPAPAPTPAPIPDTLADAQSSRGSAAPLNVPTLDEILKR